MVGAEAPLGRCAVVGQGRLGRALVAALPWFKGPFGRGFDGANFDVVILAVPDGEIGREPSLSDPAHWSGIVRARSGSMCWRHTKPSGCIR